MRYIYVCCEGVSDAGVFKSLIEKFEQVSVECKTHNEMRSIKVSNLKSGNKGREKDDAVDRKAYIRRLAHYANVRDSDYIAYHQDAGRKYEKVRKGLDFDFEEYREKGYKCLAIVPKEMTESWLLADEMAYESAYGHKPDNPALPKMPESVWGSEEDPKSNYPKHVIERVLIQYYKSPNRETYREIAENCNIITLMDQCPKSFRRFFDDIYALL